MALPDVKKKEPGLRTAGLVEKVERGLHTRNGEMMKLMSNGLGFVGKTDQLCKMDSLYLTRQSLTRDAVFLLTERHSEHGCCRAIYTRGL